MKSKAPILLSTAIVILALWGLLLMYQGKAGGSHPVPKSHTAEFEIERLQTFAAADKERLLQVEHLDNATFISVTKAGGKMSAGGELLDPWGQPYVISRNGDQITITSPGLDQYNKLSSFQKWWSNE